MPQARTITMTQADYEYLSEDYGGVCLACGEHAYGVEPDARGYECESCGANKVYGAEEALMMGYIEFGDDDE